MALVGTVLSYGDRQLHTGIAGVNDNDVVIETEDVSLFDTFQVKIGAGAADVYVSLDGTNFEGPLSLADLGAITSDPVIVMAADRMYGFRGAYRKIRVVQNGATAVTDSLLFCKRAG